MFKNLMDHLKNLFSRKRKDPWVDNFTSSNYRIQGEEVERINEANMAAMVKAAWKSGKTCIGKVDDNGKLHIEILDNEKE